MTTANSGAHARTKRVIGLSIAGIVIEGACVGLVWLSPALGVFMRPVYVVVGAIFAVMIWHAWRGRSGSDRRQEERRHSDEAE
jgi:membrane protein implicated in regulation of membrane protease activity